MVFSIASDLIVLLPLIDSASHLTNSLYALRAIRESFKIHLWKKRTIININGVVAKIIKDNNQL